MGFFTIKTVKGHEYLYIVKNKRVGGKVVREMEIYLGPVAKIKDAMDRLLAKPKKPDKPEKPYPFQFGMTTAVYSMLRRLQVAEAVDQVLPQNARDGATLGQMVEVAVINRACEPCGRNSVPDWFQESCLSHVYGFDLSPYFGQNLWNNLHDLTADQVRQIETIIFERIQKEFKLKLDVLLFDPTNFYTFIDDHEQNELPGFSGHDKHKRNDCRQVSFALCSTADWAIPLFHETHPGNTSDVAMFESMMNNWLDQLPKPYTIVPDKGNNKKALFEKIQQAGNHIVGNLKPSEHKDLIAIPLEKFDDELINVAKDQVIRMHRTEVNAYGDDYTVVITFNQALYDRQHGYLQKWISSQNALVQEFMETKLNTPKWTKPEKVEKKLQGILDYHDLKGCYKVKVWKKRGRGMGKLAVEITENEKLQYLKNRCGKNLIFTDLHDWANWKIVETCHSRWMLEDEFRKINCPETISVRPMFVWTDGSIRSYHLTIFLALQSLILMHQQTVRNGLGLSYDMMVTKLKKIWEIRFTSKRGDVSHVVSDTDDSQRALMKLFKLAQYARD